MTLSRNFIFKLFPLFILFLLFFLLSNDALGITLQWDARGGSNLAGYKLYYDIDPDPPYSGTGALEGDSPVDVPLAQDENPDPNIVEFTLNNLPDGIYYFAFTTYTDGVPPVESDYSTDVNTIQDSGTNVPVITNVRVSAKTNTTAVIEWSTNIFSDSEVQYGTSSSPWGSYTSNKSDGSLVTNHNITLTGLNGNTAYYFRVGSTDADNNGPRISNEVSFTTDTTTDTTPPVISNVLVTAKTDTAAVIEWTTDELSDSVVQYGTGGIYYAGESSISMVTGHVISLTGLNQGTTYDFRIFSMDPSGNSSTLSGMRFTTDFVPDVTPPIITNVLVASKTDDTAVIEWTTDEESDSELQFGTIPSTWGNYSSIQIKESMVTNHSITLTGLSGSTTYYFEVGSKDAADNGPSISNEIIFTTDPPDSTPPVISNVLIPSQTHNTAIIEWTTDEQSDSIVQYGTNSSSWGNYPSNQTDASMVTSHSITLNGLNGSTTYYLRIGSMDAKNNGPTISNEMSFTTNPTPDTTPPVISNLSVPAKTHNTAVIEWTTNEPSDSAIQFGTNSSSWGSYPSIENNDTMVTTHSVNLTGLNGSTTYYFRVGSTDGSGNGPTTSNQSSFTTDPTPDTTPPVLSNVQVASYTHNSAVITWTTNENGTSILRYGTGSSSWANYPSSESDVGLITSHSVTLTGLNGSTTYYFRVGSTDSSDNGPSTSIELSFTTNPPPDTTPPVLSNVQVASYTHNSAVITWTTNENSTSILRYGTGSSSWGNYPSSESDVGLVTGHSVALTGLNDSTTYYFQVGSTDAANNGPTISNEMSFITDPIPDTTPPSMAPFPVIDYTNDTIDVTFSESGMQNANTEANYALSPSLLFRSLGGSDDITSIGNNTYRLSMASVPNYLIYTLTVNNITDAASHAVTPSSIRINDNDNDGIADDWEGAFGVSDPLGDADGDDLNNLEEYNNDTNPNDSDSDGDNLPDGWEVTYSLDPNDNTGADGMNGDIDNDGWTNYEEYSNGYNPNSAASPQPAPPEIKEAIPRHNSGITDTKRIPIDSSFAVRMEDLDGIDITDATSIKFTVDDGTNPAYERDLGDTAVVRVVKLTSDADTRVTKLWVVYDRSLDAYGNFDYDADVNIKVDANDRMAYTMQQAGYDFNIETLTEHDIAEANRPDTNISNDAGMTTLTIINNDDLDGFQVVYDSNEPIIPSVEPPEEIPLLDLLGVVPVDWPVKLGPPTVFDNPVKIIMPYSGENDVSDLRLYLYDGTEWIYAVSSYNTGGVVQPGGEGWVVPGSLDYDETGTLPTIEIQVYHFSGLQAGLFSGLPLFSLNDAEAGGGCFIDTMTDGASSFQKSTIYMSLFIVLALVVAVWGKRRAEHDRVNGER